MTAEDSSVRQRILEVCMRLLEANGSGTSRVDLVAREASVSVPTIYYHFSSKAQLLAEAQAANYLKLLEPLHHCLALAERACDADDQTTFWSAVGDNMVLAWRTGQRDGGWGVLRMLIDVAAEPTTNREFSRQLQTQFERWIEVIERARQRGWIDPDLDVRALIASFWSASIGHAIFNNVGQFNPSAQRIRDFFLRTAVNRNGTDDDLGARVVIEAQAAVDAPDPGELRAEPGSGDASGVDELGSEVGCRSGDN